MTLTLLHSMLMLMMHVRKPSLIFMANFHGCHLQFWLKPSSSHLSLVGSNALCLPSIRQSCVFSISKAQSTQTRFKNVMSSIIEPTWHCHSKGVRWAEEFSCKSMKVVSWLWTGSGFIITGWLFTWWKCCDDFSAFCSLLVSQYGCSGWRGE